VGLGRRTAGSDRGRESCFCETGNRHVPESKIHDRDGDGAPGKKVSIKGATGKS
jgi:hypothetical protein